MTFQKSVNAELPIGIPGAHASINPVVSTAKGYIAGADCPIGHFVWLGTKEGTVVPTGNGTPLGIVVHDAMYSGNKGNVVPEGQNVCIATRGDFYVAVGANVTRGQKVFAKTTDGSVLAAAAGSTVTRAVETGWFVVESAAIDEVTIISYL